jgi:hypothetical protein
MPHDYDRPFREVSAMECFTARDKNDARKFGRYVKALEITNLEYSSRFNRFAEQNNMKPPPSSNIHIMSGYLVVRRLGTPEQYETWMPDGVFDELYSATAERPRG